MIPIKRILGGLAALVMLAGCEHGDPVSNAGAPEGSAMLLSANASGASVPSGTATVEKALIGFDESLTDWFGRRPANATAARRTQYFAPSVPGVGPMWEWPWDAARNANPATIDPRPSLINGVAKAPSSTTATLHSSYPYVDLYQPASTYPGDEYWEMFTRVTGLAPSTQHQFAFVHYRLKVAGELDHIERLVDGTITVPDTLVLASGTPASINTNWSGSAPAGCADFPGTNTNPFVIATWTSTADPAGRVSLDKCWKSGNGIWTAAEFDVQAKSMVGRNDNQPYTLPNYNYIEVWQGEFGTGTLVLRIQIAQDLDLSGSPIANAFAPFPAPNTTDFCCGQTAPAAVDQLEAFPIPEEMVTELPAAFALPTTVRAELRNAQALEGGAVYKAWYMNKTTGASHAATGTIYRIVGTDTVERTTGSTFVGGPGRIVFVGDDYLTSIGAADYSDSLSTFVITQEASAAATTPSNSQPFWANIFKHPLGSAGGAMTFGSFNADSAAKPSVRFVAQGTARGGVIGRREGDVFVGSILEFSFFGLQRPPKGYEYVGFLRSAEDSTDLTPVGGLSDSRGRSLDDADVAATGGDLSATQILVGRLHYNVHSQSGDEICNYNAFRLYLMPKYGAVDEPPPVLIFHVALPDRITQAESCR